MVKTDSTDIFLQLMQGREFFEKVAENEDLSGSYHLGMLYLNGIGVKRDVKKATKYLVRAANDGGLPKATYQIAKMLHTGTVLKKNLKTVTDFLTINAK